MTEAEKKAKELVERFFNRHAYMTWDMAIQCALICVENEYHSLREMLFSLRSSKVIESEKVYLSRLDKLIELEKEVKQAIENL